MYVFLPDTAGGELVPADGPEVEPVCMVTVFPELSGKLFSKMYELPATRAERWPDARQDIFRLAVIGSSHGGNRMSNNIFHAATPPGMYGGHHPLGRIEEEHGLAVGHLDGDVFSGAVGHQGVACQGRSGDMIGID